MRAVMILVVMVFLGGSCAGCEKHIKEVRARDVQIVAITPPAR